MADEDASPLAEAAVFEVLLGATFILGSVLNTVLVVVYCRRRGFRSQISNRWDY